MWAASSGLYFLAAFAALPTSSISEELYLERAIGVRLMPMTPMAEFFGLKPRLYAWPKAEIFLPPGATWPVCLRPTV